MKYPILYTFLFLTLGLLVKAGSNYQDNPLGMDSRGLEFVKNYEKQAMAGFPYFEKEFENRRGRKFYLVTRIWEGDLHEQVFVEVSRKKEGKYIGKIANNSTGLVKFERGERIELESSDIVDWLIVNQDGTEKGNTLGKVMDLIHSGAAIAITRMHPIDGKFEEFEVVSLQNGHTRQEVIELLPKEVKKKVENLIKETNRGKIADDGQDRFTFTILSFPEWKIKKQ